MEKGQKKLKKISQFTLVAYKNVFFFFCTKITLTKGTPDYPIVFVTKNIDGLFY